MNNNTKTNKETKMDRIDYALELENIITERIEALNAGKKIKWNKTIIIVAFISRLFCLYKKAFLVSGFCLYFYYKYVTYNGSLELLPLYETFYLVEAITLSFIAGCLYMNHDFVFKKDAYRRRKIAIAKGEDSKKLRKAV